MLCKLLSITYTKLMKKAITPSLLALVLTLTSCVTITPSTAEAVFGGENGRVIYGANVNGVAQFITQNPDGTDPINITPSNTSIAGSPLWSPDGLYIYYTKGGSTSDTAIYTAKADGTSEMRISDYGIYGDLALSAQGDYIYFAGDCAGVLEIKTGLAGCFSNGHANGIAASPDDQWVTFGKYDGIYRVDVNTGAETKILNQTNSWPTDWSADGTKIAFINNKNSSWRLNFMDYTGGNIVEFNTDTTYPQHDIFDAAFSPDSTSIVYSHTENPSGLNTVQVTSGLSATDPTLTLGQSLWQGKVDWQSLNSGLSTTIPTKPATLYVYRFYSPSVKRHLYTANENEAQYIIDNMAGTWEFEGGSFTVRESSNCPANQSVYRFYSQALKTHMYTMDEAEKNYISTTFSRELWSYEGVAYCADKQRMSALQKPVYRFYSPLLKTHLYTMDENEKNNIIASFPKDVWSYEGVSFYAYAD